MRLKLYVSLILFSLIAFSWLPAENASPSPSPSPSSSSSHTEKTQPKQDPFTEEVAETQHSIIIRGKPIDYKAKAGTFLLKDAQGNAKANIFYISYTKNDVKDLTTRPVTFCFNGGPGVASVWLHLGAFGPRKIVLNRDGYAAPPYHLVDNPDSLLDTTDLVFIDPVSTGFSRAVPGEEAKSFHGVNEDIQWVAEFIRLYTTRSDRWTSPKFLAGASYGTTRAAGLLDALHDDNLMYFNGVILISSVLNFQTIQDPHRGNDLPYPLFLPSYTAAAWHHKKLPQDLQNKDLLALLKESENFSINEYSVALFKGDSLDPNDREIIINKLSRFTGLSPLYIEQANLRVGMHQFTKELLRDEKRTIGRFDSRYKGIDYDICSSEFEYDPSREAISGGFAAAFNHYVRSELKWEKDDHYEIFARVHPWNYGKNASNCFLNLTDTLRETMTKNPYLHAFVATGYYDLATPYFSVDYTFKHLGLDPSLKANVTMKYYDGGHLLYTQEEEREKFNEDISAFIKASLQKITRDHG